MWVGRIVCGVGIVAVAAAASNGGEIFGLGRISIDRLKQLLLVVGSSYSVEFRRSTSTGVYGSIGGVDLARVGIGRRSVVGSC